MTDIVWDNTLDQGAYRAQVQRDDNEPYRGLLVVVDDNGNVIHKEQVGLAYAARFGPDVDDVNTWMERTVEVIDNPALRRPDEGEHPEDIQ